MADEEKTLGFTLTLDPENAAPTNAAAAAAAASVPTLTLGEQPTEEQAAQAQAPAMPVEEQLTIESLSPAEQAAVREFAQKIDVTDSRQVLTYGAAAQKNIADFSAQALEKVRTKDLGEVGDMLSALVAQLQGLSTEEPESSKGIRGLFRKASRSISDIKTQYDKAEVNVDKITAALDQHWITLNKDIVTMDQMYEMNQAYYKELSMYILAGKLRLKELRETELPRLIAKAEETGLPEDAQAANDYANLLGRFEKKIHDLELTRMICIQMGPQIRMIQNNDALMAEKIQTAIVNTIPLWKSQMVLAMSMYHSQQAMEASHSVSEVTNDLLKKNAAALHSGSVAVAQEAERGIVDIETLTQTNQELIATLEDVRKAQDDGRARRAQAEIELSRIESELKQKLLEMRG
ncbi:MAG: toxic anion resistance protein [Oscillospiraceae bacterium]|nr:toxic anion resistance protein [Oscillospiraceae bacterium]MCD8116917.1 toxic anion resistance protein [Oscillospiraceae bacterium]